MKLAITAGSKASTRLLPSASAATTGATRQQAAEAIGVTFLMHGGPATSHGARAYDAFCEFVDALEAGESAT